MTEIKKMYVVNRRGEHEPMLYDRITERLTKLCTVVSPTLKNVDPALVTQHVVKGLKPGVLTTEIDQLAAEICSFLSQIHPEYDALAARILVSDNHKSVPWTFREAMEKQNRYVQEGEPEPTCHFRDDLMELVRANAERLESVICYDRDYLIDYTGRRVLESSYLFREVRIAWITKQIVGMDATQYKKLPETKQVQLYPKEKKIVRDGPLMERHQHMLMRVALGIHHSDIDAAIETYNLMSLGYFTHATPTLFNSGRPNGQYSSCFLLTMDGDSIKGIYSTLAKCADISKGAGGIGVSVSTIRAAGSYIRGTHGVSNGLVPMLRVFNDTARYVDQGGGRRKGAFAIYLEPWHADVLEFLDLKLNNGKEEHRARDLFYALWIPNLFMRRVERDEMWSLFCPKEAPGLADCWGAEFEALYEKYENTPNLARQVIKAQDLWFRIIDTQVETGTPYMLYKDACNRKSNQQNLGTIRGSNLCTGMVFFYCTCVFLH
jgi:ribonucleotide reductase alpha subunit